MAEGQEESLRERARRVLLDNPDPAALEAHLREEPSPEGLPGVESPGAAPSPDAPRQVRQQPAGGEAAGGRDALSGAAYAREIERRMQAIRLVRELGPKRACYSERVRELSRRLASISGDSVHYRSVLDKLREAHEEWLALEQKLWEAGDVLRSTQWLVDLLLDPAGLPGSGEAAATGERDA